MTFKEKSGKDGIMSDNQGLASLKRTHQEAQRTLDNQLKEIEQARDSASRTFRTTVLLIGIILTGITAFRESISGFLSSPLGESILVEILAACIFLVGFISLIISPIFAVWALKDIEAKTGMGARDVEMVIEKSKAEPTLAEITTEGWYRLTLQKYADWIRQNKRTIERITFRLNICHSLLTYSPVAIAAGLWLMSIN